MKVFYSTCYISCILLCEVMLHFVLVWLLLQSCGLVIPVTSSAAVDIVSLSASNVMATPTVWTIQMRHLVVSVPHLIVFPVTIIVVFKQRIQHACVPFYRICLQT